MSRLQRATETERPQQLVLLASATVRSRFVKAHSTQTRSDGSAEPSLERDATTPDMCGIAAIFSSEEPISPERLEQAIRRLDHRGPDRRSQWIGSNARVGLGHARLSIIDLATGDQPIANEDEHIRIIVNGEFYEYERIQRELEHRGHILRTRSDSEIALHLYEEFGTECLAHLRGEFAFVVWDEHRKQLFAARDRFGIKPLFYASVNGTLYIASEVKALIAAGVPARWDRESLFQHLFVCMDQNRTLFAGIHQVPPGHYLIAGSQSVRLCRYWDIAYPGSNDQEAVLSEDEHLERLRYSLDEAIRIRTRADVPVGYLLSGGVDSSAVLGIAASHAERPVDAFTISFDHSAYDESPIARDTAARAGANYHHIPVSYSDFADHFAEAVWQGEMIAYNSHGVARYLLSRAVHNSGYKVVLAGEGGDELFAGYLFAQQDASLNKRERSLASDARQPGLSSIRRNRPRPLGALGTTMSLKVVERILGFRSSLLEALAENRSLFNGLLSSDFAREFRHHNPYEEFLKQFDIEGQLAGRDLVRQSMYLWTKSIFSTYVLSAERLDMAHSVEVRLPYLDHKLFDLVGRMPVSLLIRGVRQKYALREAARPYLTETVYRRTKQPFTAPPFSLTTNNRLYEMLSDILRGPIMADMPFFDPKAIAAVLESLPRMDQASRVKLDPILVMAASACLLHERYRLH